jgi:hypothetical protein
MTDPQAIDKCEVCGEPISDGDKSFRTSDEIFLCEKHAPMLSDCIAEHEDILSRVPWNPGEMPYETRKEMVRELNIMKAQLAQSGDRNLAS